MMKTQTLGIITAATLVGILALGHARADTLGTTFGVVERLDIPTLDARAFVEAPATGPVVERTTLACGVTQRASTSVTGRWSNGFGYDEQAAINAAIAAAKADGRKYQDNFFALHSCPSRCRTRHEIRSPIVPYDADTNWLTSKFSRNYSASAYWDSAAVLMCSGLLQ